MVNVPRPPRTRLRFLTFFACLTVLIRESLLSLNTAERLFLAMPKHRKEKKEREEKKKREKSGKSGSEKYLLLTELEVRTESYGPSFFSPSIYGPSPKRAGYKSQGKKR